MSRKTLPFSFSNSLGDTLAGLIDMPEGVPLAYGVFGPCFTCVKESHAAARICRALAESGIAMLRFDTTGVGASAGQAGQADFAQRVADLKAAVAAMGAAYAPPRLLVGHSLSGTAALAAAAELPQIAVIATVCAPADTQAVIAKFRKGGLLQETPAGAEINVLGRVHSFGPGFVADMLAQDVAGATARIGRPVYVFHAPNDDIVSFDNAPVIAARVGDQARLVRLPEAATHLFNTRTEDAEEVARVLALALAA